MDKRTRKLRAVEGHETTLGELIHREIREAIEKAVFEELEAALGRRYERIDAGSGRAIGMASGFGRSRVRRARSS